MSGLEGLEAVCFESRRGAEMATLLEKQGARVTQAPSMREVPVEAPEDLPVLLDGIAAGEVDVLLFLTGVGTRHFLSLSDGLVPRAETVRRLRASTLVAARGPKPASVLRLAGVEPWAVAPEPNTWREMTRALDARGGVQGKRVVLVEHGGRSDALREALAERGARVEGFCVYRWALPEDVGPLRRGIRQIAQGRADLVLFTSARQVVHVFHAAREAALEEALREGLGRAVVASVGPVCTEALVEHGVRVDVEPQHPKMGHLVVETARRAPAILARDAT